MAEHDGGGNAAGSAGFLSRWSQRKTDARQGAATAEEAAAPAGPSQQRTLHIGAAPAPADAAETAVGAAPPPPPPSLADVRSLTGESDFSPFMARGVAPDVRNAAMKKLFFSDPHFNVMDGLDIYIDDYTKPAPLTTAMLERMVSARFLGLFDDPKHEEAANAPGPVPLAAPRPAGVLAVPAIEPNRPAPHDDGDLSAGPVAHEAGGLSMKKEGGDDHADL